MKRFIVALLIVGYTVSAGQWLVSVRWWTKKGGESKTNVVFTAHEETVLVTAPSFTNACKQIVKSAWAETNIVNGAKGKYVEKRGLHFINKTIE